MANLSKVVKVTAAQMDTLAGGGTVSGETYDANAMYLVDGDQTATLLFGNGGITTTSSMRTGTLTDSIANYSWIHIFVNGPGASGVYGGTGLTLPASVIPLRYNGNSANSGALAIVLAMRDPSQYTNPFVPLHIGFPTNTTIAYRTTIDTISTIYIYGIK